MEASTSKLYLSVMIVLHAVASGDKAVYCNPSSEGSEFIVNMTWVLQHFFLIHCPKYDKAILTCRANKNPLCSCGIPCPFDEFFVSEAEEAGKRNVTMRMKNATLAMSGLWKATYLSSLNLDDRKMCIVTAFSKKIECNTEKSKAGVIITCVIRRIAPKLKCDFKIIPLEGETGPTLGEIEYPKVELTSENDYRNASCKVPITLDDKTERFQVEARMFPNATGDDSDMKWGSHVNIVFDLSLSVSCSIVPDGGTSLLSITWNSITSIEISRDNGEMKITCSPNTPCQATNLEGYIMDTHVATDGKSSLTLIFQNATQLGYRPGVSSWTVTNLATSKSVQGTCTLFEQSTKITCNYKPTAPGLNMSCSTPRTLLRMMCQFEGKNEERLVPPEIVKYQHTSLTDGVGFKTYCNALVPWNMFIKDTSPVVHVITFPNVTGKDEDVKYGEATDVEVSLGSTSVTLQKCPPKVEKGDIVSCTCTSLSDQVIVTWKSSSSDYQLKDNTITFIATAFKERSCYGKNYLGVVGMPTIYDPEIYYTPQVKYGRELTYNDTSPDKLYITCKEPEDLNASVTLVEETQVFSWKCENHVQEFKTNLEKCPRSKPYKCIFLAEHEMDRKSFTRFIKCESVRVIEEPTDTYVVYFLIFFAVDIVVGGLYILWRVFSIKNDKRDVAREE